jgi:hypothetical protein
MLNGISPVIIFHIFNTASIAKVSKWLKNSAPAQSLIPKVGIPIPIYLHETSLKAVFVSHDSSISIGERVMNDTVFQAPVSNLINIEINFNNNPSRLSLPLPPIALLLPLLNLCYSKLTRDDYRISYFNRDVAAQMARLIEFRQFSRIDSDLSTLNITLSRDIKFEAPESANKEIISDQSAVKTPLTSSEIPTPTAA